jgi:transcriptional regulator with XRE-family HTH domain
MTLVDVGNLTGISKTYLSQLENGKHDVKLSTLEKITKALGYEIHVVPME